MEMEVVSFSGPALDSGVSFEEWDGVQEGKAM